MPANIRAISRPPVVAVARLWDTYAGRIIAALKKEIPELKNASFEIGPFHIDIHSNGSISHDFLTSNLSRINAVISSWRGSAANHGNCLALDFARQILP
jgi:hypothetical protein